MLLPTILPVRWPIDSYGEGEVPTAHDYSVWMGHAGDQELHDCEYGPEDCWGPLICNIGDDGFIHYCTYHTHETFHMSPPWPAEDYDPDSWDVGYYLSLI